MTRKADQMDRIEALARLLTEALAGHAAHLREQVAAIRIEVRDARASAESAHAGVQALADMLPVDQATTDPAPHPPPAVPTAAGGGTEGEPVTAARRAPKTLKPKDQM